MKLSSLIAAIRLLLQDGMNSLNLAVTQTFHVTNRIVTAFDSTHFLSGIQLLESLFEFGHGAETIVYNLGLTDSESEEIQSRFPQMDFRVFPFNNYPSHFNVKKNAGQYAWKPVIIASLLEEGADHVIWLDAGDKLISNLDNFNKLVDKYGFFSVPTSNTILELTHVQSIELLEVDTVFCAQLQLSAAFIGFSMKDIEARKLLADWAAYAINESVIAPSGSDRSNHRQDQSIFNLLVARNDYLRNSAKQIIAKKYKPKHHGILTHQDLD